MSTTRIPKAEITGLYGAVVRRFSKKLLGRVPEPLGVSGTTAPCSRRLWAWAPRPTGGMPVTLA